MDFPRLRSLADRRRVRSGVPISAVGRVDHVEQQRHSHLGGRPPNEVAAAISYSSKQQRPGCGHLGGRTGRLTCTGVDAVTWCVFYRK
jgi:hypothetical protein